MKKFERNNAKIAKGIEIGYVIFIGLILIGAITIFIVVFSKLFTSENTPKETKEEPKQEINEKINKEEVSEVKDFNSNLESYVGTKTGSKIVVLIDNVVLKTKKNPEHMITLIYNNKKITDPDEMIKLKANFNESKKYEVTFDYNKEGYISKLTIFDVK